MYPLPRTASNIESRRIDPAVSFYSAQKPPQIVPLRPSKLYYGRSEPAIRLRPNGRFWSANGLGPIVFTAILIFSMIAAMAVPWVYQTQRVVHNNNVCSWVEMRGWTRLYCRKLAAPAACDDVFASGPGRLCSAALSIDSPSTPGEKASNASATRLAGFDYLTRSRTGLHAHHEALNARDAAVAAAASVAGGGGVLLTEVLAADADESGFDWRAVHSALGVNDATLRSIFTRSAILTGAALLCAIGTLLGFVVRCIAPTRSDRTAWHISVTFVGTILLAVALVSFATAHPRAYRNVVESFPPTSAVSVAQGAVAGAIASAPHSLCDSGPCASFSGALTPSSAAARAAVSAADPAADAVTTVSWGPAGWYIAACCLLINMVLAVWSTLEGSRYSDTDGSGFAAADAIIAATRVGGNAGGAVHPSRFSAGPSSSGSGMSDGGGFSSEADELDVTVGIKRRARTTGAAAIAANSIPSGTGFALGRDDPAGGDGLGSTEAERAQERAHAAAGEALGAALR